MDPLKIAQLLLSILNVIIDYLGREQVSNLVKLSDVERSNALSDVAEYIKFGRLSNSQLAPLPSDVDNNFGPTKNPLGTL